MSDNQSLSSGAEGVCDGSLGGSLSTSPGPEPINDAAPPASEKAPFQASVEDCPEEDGVPLGTPPRVPVSPVDKEPAIPVQTNIETNSAQKDPEVPQEHSMPAFIQLSGPAQDQPPPDRPEPLRYLAPDSPALTKEAIQRSVSDNTHLAQPVATSPSTLSHHSSVSSGPASDVFSQGGHRNNSSHDGSSWGSDFDDSVSHVSRRQFNPPNQYQGPPAPANAYPQPAAWPGSPQMPYGSTHASPYPAHAMADTFQGPPVPPPPPQAQWPQRLPMTGYQFLAARLTGDFMSFPKVTPVYRRFGAVNHRLLLQLQDEIVELEQKLDQLDETDTHARMGPYGAAPASRRGEVASQSSICIEKQILFREIGWRLESYYKLLESFRNLQFIPCPSQIEIDDYRAFLAREQVIHESETRFLDRDNDLISLTAIEYEESHHDSRAAPNRKEDATPTPQSTSAYSSPQVKKAAVDAKPPPSMMRKPIPRQRPPTDFAYAVLGAVAAPLLSFTVVSGFAERMVVVGIVFVFAAALVAQSNLLSTGPERLGLMECSICGVMYASFMGVFAWSFS